MTRAYHQGHVDARSRRLDDLAEDDLFEDLEALFTPAAGMTYRPLRK
jgi:hypothetical protein